MSLQFQGCELGSDALLHDLRQVAEPSHAFFLAFHLFSVFQT